MRGGEGRHIRTHHNYSAHMHVHCNAYPWVLGVRGESTQPLWQQGCMNHLSEKAEQGHMAVAVSGAGVQPIDSCTVSAAY